MFRNLNYVLKFICLGIVGLFGMFCVNVSAAETEEASIHSVTDSLTNMVNEGPDQVADYTYYEAVLVPEEGYMLPDSIAILVDGQELKRDWAYMYSSKTGELVIYRTFVKGDIEIIGEAVQKVYGVSLNFDTIHFSDVELDGEGNYEENEYKIVTITNTGNCPIEGFSVASNAKESAFLVLYESERIKPGQTSSFCVEPKTGLLEGEYSEVITLTTEEGLQAQVEAYFNVLLPEMDVEAEEKQDITEKTNNEEDKSTEEEEQASEPERAADKGNTVQKTAKKETAQMKSPKTGNDIGVWWIGFLIVLGVFGCGVIIGEK